MAGLSQLAATANISQLIRSMPSMLVNIPGLGQIDISKLPPSLIEHVLRGGQVPGVPQEALDSVLRQYAGRLRQFTGSQQTVDQSGHVPSVPNEGSRLPATGYQVPPARPNQVRWGVLKNGIKKSL